MLHAGISSHLFAYETFSREILCTIKNAGFGRIELWGMFPHLSYWSDSIGEQIHTWLNQENMTISSLHGPFYKNIVEAKAGRWLSLADSCEEQRKEAIKEAEKIISLAAELAIPIVVFHMGGNKPENSHQQQMKRSIDQLLPFAIRKKVTIALENIITNFSSTEQIVTFVESYQNNHLGICLDIGHAHLNETPVQAIKNCKNNLFSLHISDNQGESDQHLVPGSGSVNWHAVTQALEEIAFSGPLNLELRSLEKEYKKTLQQASTFTQKFGWKTT